MQFRGQSSKKILWKRRTKNASEFSFITEGEFEEFKQGDIVFLMLLNLKHQILLGEQNMEEIFIYIV